MPVTDARTLPDASVIEADIVIIGGGMAGLTLAHELAGTAARVAVLESGGPEPDREIQGLYAGQGVWSGPGVPDQPMDDYMIQSRVRALGGSGHVWGGKCGPLDEADFAERDWIPLSGWPLGRREMKPFYDRACDLLKLPHFPADDGLPEGDARPVMTRVDGAVRSPPRFYSPVSGRRDPAAFAEFRDAPGRAPNIHVHTHVNATAVRLKADGSVDRLELRCLNGTRHIARARLYVMATGGIENARLMLASTADRPEGVGNGTGWVGRCFQGHPNLFQNETDDWASSALMIADTTHLGLYDNDPVATAHGVMALSLPAQREVRCGNISATLMVRSEGRAAAYPAPVAIAQMATATTGSPGAAKLVPMYFKSENLPNPESRIVLAPTTDALGQPQARLEWRFTDADWRSIDAGVEAFGRGMGGDEIGRLCWPQGPGDRIPPSSPARHHMGTTRMSVDPAQGVVDADCRVHDSPNLYIAGSSVFPTSGLVNPTLTLTALAIRLADHLKITMGIAR